MDYGCICFLESDKYLTKNELNTHRDIHIHIHIHGKAISDLKMKCKLLPSLISSETSDLKENKLIENRLRL